MKITEIKLVQEKECQRLSGYCGDFLLWYEFPLSMDITLKADAFVAASLIPAMATKQNIELADDIPVSAQLLSNLSKLQDIFSRWEAQLGVKLHKIDILGGQRVEALPVNDHVISFFSGGVDGTYTFLKNKDDIDLLLFSKGIDMQLDNVEQFEHAFEKNKVFLDAFEKPLVPIATNVRFFGHSLGLKWTQCFGGGLASIALAASVKTCYIASGFTYGKTIQEGSNYITDPLWSNGTTHIVHDGAEANRLEKIAFLATEPTAIALIRVCWQDKGYNCGQCEKCLRTMTNLRLLGLSTPNFPPLTDELVKNKVSKLRLYSVHDVDFLQENLALAVEKQDKVMVKALKKISRHYYVKHHIKGLLKQLS
ncbi:hypothetical protein [Thalassotalea agarivorans]|uniref:7-cyano-7-deazaguanine synthase (Queuosine biosynthesis) n=1 Tax=Thalassotalea agarivorans TaxID=349064 RepID=A0A1I0DVK3_THASX|nr:hypothetical protein [Thalassotalea agarivorans]SET36705.1 hypothetical protein SAMN05660429_01620 [Thalassotalea agarivorans]